MASRSDQRIGFRAAAELIFRTRHPDAQQVQRVRELVESGELAGTSRGTTPEAVAQLLARAARRRDQTSQSPPRRAEGGAHGEALASMYQQTLKDFFLAVILRRRIRHAGKRFQYAVIAAQAGILAAVLIAVVAGAGSAFLRPSAEQIAVTTWLEENTHKFRVVRWHPPETNADGKTQMRVEYYYRTRRGKGVDTDRMFTISQHRVVRVDSAW